MSTGQVKLTNLRPIDGGYLCDYDISDGPTPPPPDPYWKEPGYVSGKLLADVYGQYVDAFGRPCVPGPPRSGAIDIEYYTGVVIATGGWVNPVPGTGENNIGYWTDKIGRDLVAHGYRRRS